MKRSRWILIGSIFLAITALCLYPAQSKDAAVQALRLCGSSVIPALFPFFVLTKLLTSNLSRITLPGFLQRLMERLFGLSGACLTPLLLSFLGGYPVGVSCLCDLYNEGAVSKSEAQRALLFCNNSGPAFFMGVLGAAVFNDVKAGLMLYLIHILSALLVGRIFARPPMTKASIRRIPKEQEPLSQQFLSAIGASCASLLQICGLVLFFSVLMRLLECIDFFPPGKELGTLIYGTMELTGGILRLTESPNAFIIAAFFMGWGGFCVHFQAMGLWQKSGLHPQGYFLAKFLHGATSALIAQCVIAPGLLDLAILGAFMLFAVVFPEILKKTAGNLQTYKV